MISIGGHYCITMHISYNLDDESSSIEDCPSDMHLETCPTPPEEQTGATSVINSATAGIQCLRETSPSFSVLGRRERSLSLEVCTVNF